ncbi:MAG: hypothetical protein Q9M31_10565 [Mariprofundus sp.]|nr:hypothetical protein [Mariprofundus sp.]
MIKLRYAHIYLPVFVVLWLGLFLDSSALAKQFVYNQWFTNVLVLLSYVWIFCHVSKVIQQLMLFGLLVGLGGELLFSIILGMYTYRLGNIPLYVPFGHAIIYACVYYIAKEPVALQYRETIYRILYCLMIIYATLWLFVGDDLFGFCCMLVTLWLLHRHPESRFFFLLMFFMIIYLELLGTHYHCWQWPTIWFNELIWMTSGNPPSGIGVFYFAFDVGCLYLYKRWNIQRWHRFRAIQKIRRSMLS